MESAAHKTKKQQELDEVPSPVFEFTDVPQEKQLKIAQIAKQAYLARSKGEMQHWYQLAEFLKKEADKQLGPTWHCVVGTSFGSFVTFERSSVAYFSVAEMNVLLFKHG
jgi:dynein light chain LC8-type